MIPKRIVLHHSLTADSGTVSWGAIRRYHTETNGWSAIGYHFGIELVGDWYEVLLGRMMNETGAHTAGQNHDSLGVCFVGNFDETPVPDEQWRAGVKLVRGLCTVFGIPASQIYGHREFAPKSCPGKLFDVARFAREVMKA
jgi:N-acetylmuramoyl-L-alanine amidase